jgi:hypothetical protein
MRARKLEWAMARKGSVRCRNRHPLTFAIFVVHHRRLSMAMPPKVTVEVAKGFTLCMLKAVFNGRDDLHPGRIPLRHKTTAAEVNRTVQPQVVPELISQIAPD